MAMNDESAGAAMSWVVPDRARHATPRSTPSLAQRRLGPARALYACLQRDVSRSDAIDRDRDELPRPGEFPGGLWYRGGAGGPPAIP